MSDFTPTPGLDLVLERTIPVPVERVWAAWTEPALLMQWFTPAPWKTVAADLDVPPGGRCNTTMESPDGERYPNAGCYLEVEPNRLLVFTSVMTEGYRAVAIHADETDAGRHAEMGFHDGWGAALDQLVALQS